MFRLKHLICSEIVTRDSDTNKISFINVFESLEAEGFPFVLVNFSITAIFSRDLADNPRPACSVRLSFESRELLSTPLNVDFADKRLTRSIVRMQGFVIERPGELTVTVMHEGNILATDVIGFTQRAAPPVQLTMSTG